MLSCACNRNVILRKKHAYVKECVCVILCVCVYTQTEDQANVGKCSPLNINAGNTDFHCIIFTLCIFDFFKVKNSEEKQTKNKDSKLC